MSSASISAEGGTDGPGEAGGAGTCSIAAEGGVAEGCVEGSERSGAVVTGGGGGGGEEGPGSDGMKLENLRKNCLFLSVTRPLPSTLILYLL